MTSSTNSGGGVGDHEVLDGVFNTSSSGSVPQLQYLSQTPSSPRPSPSAASISTLIPVPSNYLSSKVRGSAIGEPPDDDGTPRPQFRHWRPHSTSSFPPVNKFTLAGVLHSCVSSHQLNRLGYTNEANNDERNTNILPPYISPADSPTDRPSTPLPEKFQGTDGLEAMVRAQSSIGKAVDWDEKLKTASPDSYLRDTSSVWEGQERPVVSDLTSCEDDLTNRPVERSISAVMATESNSRSRKATQRLGLFRENEQAIEERGREKQRREEKEREKEKERQEKQRAKEIERAERKKTAGAEGKEQGFRAPLVTEAEEDEKKLPQESSSNFVSVSRTKDDRYSPPSCDELSASKAVPGDTPSPASHFVPPGVTSVVSFGITEPVFDPSSSSSAQRDIDSSTVTAGSSETSASIMAQESLSDPLGGDQDLSIEIPRKPTERIRIVPADQAEDDEDEESDKDEISSALYFPHPTPSISQDSVIAIKKANPAAGQPGRKDVTNIDVTRDDTPSISHNTGPEFDLSIQSGDDEYHYHAERRNRTNTDDDYSSYHSNNEGYSSAASGFSEYSDSNDESSDEIGQDGSEIDTTPTATPDARHRDPKHGHHPPHGQTTNKSHSRSNPTQTAQVPLGAVELKPYNHQVGGHTALFRFSRRAVCKSLSNKENEFYEAVEKRHPELLGFLPK